MFSKLILTGLLVISSVTAFADVVKEGRSNDIASKYILEDDGDFFRIVNGNKCQITNGVSEFKISAHKKDVAMLYFKKDGNLYILKNITGSTGNCPKADKSVLVANIKKYTVVSNTTSDSEVVNLTLDSQGLFRAWSNTKSVFAIQNVKDYVNNTCFGTDGLSYSSYTAFAITYEGQVFKVKGGEADAKADKLKFSDLGQFKDFYNVCKK
jgi:hypothetical protein